MKVYDDIIIKGTLDGLSGASGDVLYHNGTSWVRLAPGSNGQVLTLASGIPSWAAGGGGAISSAVIGDVKAYNADGGGFTSGAWRQRDLQTEISDPDGIVSLSGNDFTINSAGTYRIDWSAPAYAVNGHVTELYDVTGSVRECLGSMEKANSSYLTTTRSFGSRVVTIGAARAYRLNHKCSSTKSTDGFGYSMFDSGTDAIYSIVVITKLA